jgi:predicted lipoprotein with Yx(FWY)xxD motif
MATKALMVRRGLVPLAGVVTAFALGVPAGALAQRVVKVERVASLGTVLFNEKGFALYTYGSDTKNHSNCNGSCLSAWPALTVAKGVTPTGISGLGVIVRSNGKRQVTWHGRPLYTFASDTKGKVTGNGVAGFHAAIMTKASASSTTSTTTATRSYNY